MRVLRHMPSAPFDAFSRPRVAATRMRHCQMAALSAEATEAT